MKTKFMGPLTNGVMAVVDIIAMAILTTVAVSCRTSNQMRTVKTNYVKLHDSVLVDNDGNRYSVKILRDNNLWMTANLKLNIPGSYCYENTEENCERYGRLYTWESAKKGCSLLGDGWRLPAKDEWQRLTVGGGRAPDSQYSRLDAHGFYWTATESDSTAWFYNFGKGSQALYQQDDGEK